MSTFQISATTVTFLVNQDRFVERWANLLRTWDLELYLPASSDYTALAGLLSQPIHVGFCPGSAGGTPYVQIGGGAGPGTLTLDSVVGSPFNAALASIERPSAYPGGGRTVRVSFQECPT